MKTRYSRRPRSLVSSFGLPFLGVLALIVLVIVLRAVFPGALTVLATPLWQLGAASARIALPQSTTSLTAERDALKAQVDALLLEKLALQEQLRDLGPLALEEEGVSAGVLVRPPVTPYDVLIVNAGATDGVREGQRVYGPGGTPVGTVSEVSASRSRVALYSSAGRESAALVGEERTPLTLIGRGSGAYFASVSADAPVIEGDTVLIDGAGAVPLGTVARIEKDASSPEAVLHIRPLANPFTLTWVRIAAELP